MVDFTPRKIMGQWRQGLSLDLHTLRSDFLGHDEYGHARFDTVRSPVGELLYRLKYGADRAAVGEIAEAAAKVIDRWRPAADLLVPVPPSTPRPWQPVTVLAEAIGRRTGIPVLHAVTRVKESPKLKDVFDLDERLRILAGLHVVDAAATRGKDVLLFDDLYRSGATMNAITEVLYRDGAAKEVFALTVTRTRSNQ